MKKKSIAKWILLLAAVAAVILVLTMCTKSRGTEEAEALPALAAETGPSAAETAQTEATTEPLQETTAPVEETTEPTEETTEPEEEEEPEETNASDSGSNDSTSDEEDFGEEEPYWEGPDPGTPENPFLEVLTEYPAQVNSVNIPKGVKVSYIIDGSAGAVVSVQDSSVMLTVEGKTYTADAETGTVTVDLSKLGKDPVLTLAHSGKSAASFVLDLQEGLGGAGKPELLTDPQELEIILPEGDDDGYHYQWISDVTGKVELSLKEREMVPEETEVIPEEPENDPDTEETVPPEEPVLEVIVTIGEQVIRLSECEDGKISFDAVEGQDIRIQVIAEPFMDGSYPAIEEILVWNRIPALGTEENPEILESISSISVTLEEGNQLGRWFRWTADTYGTVTLETNPEKLTLTAKLDQTVAESADGIVTFPVEMGQQVLIHALAVPDEAGNYPAVLNEPVTAEVAPEAGTPENPAELESLENLVIELKENDHDGYTVTWTAAYDGTLELTAQTEGTAADVIVISLSETVSRLSEMPEGKLTAELKAGESITLQAIAVPDENGSYGAATVTLEADFVAAFGSSPETPITISPGETEMAVKLEERQTVYFTGMLQEMVMTVKDAAGVSIHYGEDTVWASHTGNAEVMFSGEEGQEPVGFSMTSKNAVELTMTFAYPAGHEKNPAELELGTNTVALEEGDTDGYIFRWTAPDDGQLTISVSGKSGWQYRLDGVEEGERYTSSQETPVPSQTLEVKAGDQMRLVIWTLPAGEGDALLAGTVTVTADFFDPLLGTEKKPVRLDAGKENKVTVKAGESICYTAEADGMRLHFTGRDVTLTHNGAALTPENGGLELMCQGAESLFRITNPSEKDQTCILRFEYPQGHGKNPAALTMGENRAALEEGSISGYSFSWTAEGSGFLTVTMPEETGWQFLLCNKTAGLCGVVHTSGDQPLLSAETVEVAKGDQIRVVVNTFDQEHPLDAPAGEIVFTAEFVDPTLGLEENPVWLNQEDTVSIPAGKTMYCTAKADGMILTLRGTTVTVSHNGETHTQQGGEVSLLCTGTGTFGHPVFALTNTGTEDKVYTVSFTYPEGHFLNPMELELKEQTVTPGKSGQYFLWEAEENGVFTFTINSESGWRYVITNVTASETGEQCCAEDEETLYTQTLAVKAGDQLRIMVNTEEKNSGEEISFTASFETEESLGEE